MTLSRLLPLMLASFLLAPLPCAGTAWAQYGPIGPPAPGPLRIVGGGAAGGCIAGAQNLPPQGDNYQTIHGTISHFYGAPATLQGIATLARRARELGLPPLLIEDISRPRGGPMPGGHVSHQVGLDVDVALDMRPRGYLNEAERAAIQIASVVRPDYRDTNPATWNEGVVRLIWQAATLPGVDRVLVNAAIKKGLCRDVQGGDRSWLRYVRPWYGHAAHMHITFLCPPAQPECVTRPPPPPGDGCDQLQWWFDQLSAPDKPSGPPKRKPPLPEACRAVFAAPAG